MHDNISPKNVQVRSRYFFRMEKNRPCENLHLPFRIDGDDIWKSI